MSVLTVGSDVTKRRDKLARQLAKLDERNAKVADELEAATRAWENALEAGTDTARHAARRRALSGELEDLAAEARRVGGWLAEIDEKIAAAERRAQLEAEFAAESQRFAADVERLAAVQMYTPEWRKAAAEVRSIAQEAVSRYVEARQLSEALPGRRDALRAVAAELGVPWSPPAIPGPPADLERPSHFIGRAMVAAASGDVAATARELGQAAEWEA